jgi:RNA polymerase sigma factor (sigma-70 family)
MTELAAELEPRAAEATRLLFETHERRIFSYCLGQLGNRHDAEDAAQTTFLYAFGCLERGVVPEAELAWLFTIALNVCRTRRRSLGRRRRIEAPTDFDACEYALAAPERGDDELFGLSGALAAMPANQRSALLLREWQGLSYAEIADRLTISQSAVETLLFRARRTLASHLRRIPQKVAVMANAPVLLRLFRRLVPHMGAIKAAGALVAIGAVSAVGGQELARNLDQPARVQSRTPQHLITRPPSEPMPHRHASMAPVSMTRTSRPHRTEATSTAEAAPPRPAEPSTTPPAASQSSFPQVSLPTPQLPLEPPATTAGELSGSAVVTATAVVQAVDPPVVPAGVPDLAPLLPHP